MNLDKIEVAVVIAAYNAEATLLDALNSVLASSIRTQVFIIDDASVLPVVDVLKAKIGELPKHVEVIRRTKNGGPSPARNVAIRRAIELDLSYIAVLDADDISHPERFAKQLSFLKANPNVGAVGTWGNLIDEITGAVISSISYPPVLPGGVRLGLCYDNCIINSSVMLRTSALKKVGLWNESMYTGEDYDLFCRISKHYDIANIPEYLISYRASSRGISRSGVRAQRYARLQVQLRYLVQNALYWQAWLGILISALRVLIPTSLVERYKQITNRRTVF